MLALRSTAKLFAFVYGITLAAIPGATLIAHVHGAIARCCGWWANPVAIFLAVTEGMLLALGCIAAIHRGWLD